MPRTKVNKKRKINDTLCSVDGTLAAKPKDLETIIDEIKSLAEQKKAEVNRLFDSHLKTIENYYKFAFKRAEKYGSMTIGELRAAKIVQEKKNLLDVASSGSMRSKRSSSCDSRPRKALVLRSSSCNRIPMSANKYRTPINQLATPLSSVTPKMNPNVPTSILRRPKQGEYAISISGSPLMVSGVVSDELATVSIPLKNGNVLSILPHEGVIDMSGLHLDEHTRMQLQRLKENLDKCLK